MTKKFFHRSENQQDKPLVLIAGGAGFIGSFLCELLLNENCRVVCLDNLQTGSKRNLTNCSDNENFHFLKQDITQPLKKVFENPAYIFHLAGLEAYFNQKNHSLESLLVNVAGTINLLQLAKETGAKFLLGSNQKIFQAKISTQQLIDYFGEGAPGELASFSEAKRSAEAITTEYVERYDIDARVVRFDWVYGPRMNLNTAGIISQIINQGVEGKPLKIPGDGSEKIRPIFVSDVVSGLFKAMFGSGTTGKIFNLTGPDEVSLFSLAQTLQELISTDLKIEYISQKEAIGLTTDSAVSGKGELNWHPHVGLKEGLKQTLAFFKKSLPKKKKGEKSKPTGLKNKLKKKSGINFKHLLALIIFALLATVFYLPGALVFNSFLGVGGLKLAYDAVISGQFVKTSFLAGTAERSFQRAQDNLNTLTPVFVLFNQERVGEKIDDNLTIGGFAGKGMEELGEIGQNFGLISHTVFKEETGNLPLLTATVKRDLDSAYEHFSHLEGQLKLKPKSGQILTRFDKDFINHLSVAREFLLQAREGIVFLPELSGVYGKKTYLVLFQNNMELRPTGGFIGSFALATFDEGKLLDFQVMDVYDADGQLKGHVEPPEPISQYLDEAGWYLRDANFSPDFPVTAQRAAWFLEKELDKKVDGVVGVDLFLVQRILRAMGPVILIDYQEEVNADNLFEKAEYYSEVNFFPGSTQKKDFLGAVVKALFEKVRFADEKEWLALGQAIYQSLKSKDLLVYLHHQEAARIMAQLGWDGGLRNIKCQMAIPKESREAGNVKCLVDYLMIVEANFGVNKANYFVKRELNYQVEFGSQGEISEILEIDYHNQSQSEVFPAGDYKNYLRILTPLGTVLEKVAIDGEEVEEEKIDEEEIEGKTAFGFLVEVPIQAKRTVVINYQLADKVNLEGSRYLLYLQKQPGIEDEVFNFWLKPPEGKRVVSTKPESSLAGGFTVFALKFNQDLVFEIELGR